MFMTMQYQQISRFKFVFQSPTAMPQNDNRNMCQHQITLTLSVDHSPVACPPMFWHCVDYTVDAS